MKLSANLRATIICLHQDKILLVRKATSRWMLPGGKVEDDESPTAAARREMMEETDLRLDDLKFEFEYSGKKRTHYVYSHAAITAPEVQAQNEIEECRWFLLSEIANLRIGATMRAILAIMQRPTNSPT